MVKHWLQSIWRRTTGKTAGVDAPPPEAFRTHFEYIY